MKDRMAKLMGKKQASGEMSEPEKAAKKSVLQELQKMATEAMGGKLHGLRKVEVEGNSPEALEGGLEHAKHLLTSMHDEKNFNDDTNEDHGEGDMMPEMDHEHEGDDDDGMQEDEGGMPGMPEEDEDMPEHEINAKLEKLMALKRKKGMK